MQFGKENIKKAKGQKQRFKKFCPFGLKSRFLSILDQNQLFSQRDKTGK